jgi:hypothetical protein
MLQQQGTLILRPLQAELMLGNAKYSKMDSYIKFKLGKHKLKSSKCKNGGVAPKWQDIIEIPKPIGEDILHIDIYAARFLLLDEKVASAEIHVSQFLPQQQMQINQNINLHHKDESAGTLLLSLEFRPQAVLPGKSQMGLQQQQYHPEQHPQLSEKAFIVNPQQQMGNLPQQPIGGNQPFGMQQQQPVSQAQPVVVVGHQQSGIQQQPVPQVQPVSDYQRSEIQKTGMLLGQQLGHQQ